jgi:hypothetical protein
MVHIGKLDAVPIKTLPTLLVRWVVLTPYFNEVIMSWAKLIMRVSIATTNCHFILSNFWVSSLPRTGYQ